MRGLDKIIEMNKRAAEKEREEEEEIIRKWIKKEILMQREASECREEVISMQPFLSIFHKFIDREVEKRLKEIKKELFKEWEKNEALKQQENAKRRREVFNLCNSHFVN